MSGWHGARQGPPLPERALVQRGSLPGEVSVCRQAWPCVGAEAWPVLEQVGDSSRGGGLGGQLSGLLSGPECLGGGVSAPQGCTGSVSQAPFLSRPDPEALRSLLPTAAPSPEAPS